EGGAFAAAALHHGRHPLTPAFVGNTDHQGVEDFGVAFQRALDLFGVDLLAAAVDAHRAAAQHRDGAVFLDPRVVAGDRVPDAVVFLERRRGLHRVVVVTDRDMPLTGQQADLPGAGGHRVAVVVDHRGRRVDLHSRSTGVGCALGGDGDTAEPGFRGA